MVVLAIGAHPDDIEFGCYGTLAKLSQHSDVHFMLLSAGELSGPKLKRIEEAKRSASLIKATIKLLDYADGAIPLSVKTIDEVRGYIAQIKPDIVFTPYPNDTHQDHRNASRIAISSCQSVNKILFYEIPSTESDFHPNLYYDITDYFYLKEKALNCHKTQRGKPYLDLDEIRGLALYRAYLCHRHGRLFEAFYLYREVET